MTIPSVTGSITQIQNSSTSTSQSISIPADAELCLFMCAHWITGGGLLTSITLDGNAFTSVIANESSSTENGAIWRYIVPAPLRGTSKTLAWTFDDSLVEGANIFVVFLKNVDTSGDPIRDSDKAGAGGTGTSTTPAITTDANDLMICVVASYGSTDANAGLSGQTEIADSTEFNSDQGAIGTKNGSAGTTTMSGSGADRAVLAASIKGSAGALSATVNQTTETDTAQALTKRKQKAIGQNTETDLAQALTRVKRLLIGQNSETDSAQTFTARKVLTIGQVSETDSAQAFTPLADIVGTVNQVAEIDTVQAFTARKVKEIAQVTETDSTQALTVRKEKAIAQISETDTAQSLSASKARVISQVEETDTAQTILSIKQKSIGQVEEIDLAQPFTETGAIVAVIGQVVETDLAQQLFPLKRVAIAQVVEIDFVQSMRVVKIKAIGQVTEIDLAQALSLGQEVTGFLRELHLYPRTTKLTLSLRSTELTLHKRSLKLNLKEVDV